jgi:hypothetical protein
LSSFELKIYLSFSSLSCRALSIIFSAFWAGTSS